MKLSELKAPQMVSVAVQDGHDSFFKITFVISLSEKKKKHDLSHFWYVSKRPVIIRRPGKGATLGRGASWKRGGLEDFVCVTIKFT